MKSGSDNVYGTVWNNSDEEIVYLQINIDIFDNKGSRIGTINDFIFNLAAGQAWSFDALNLDSDIASFKITGFN